LPQAQSVTISIFHRPRLSHKGVLDTVFFLTKKIDKNIFFYQNPCFDQNKIGIKKTPLCDKLAL